MVARKRVLALFARVAAVATAVAVSVSVSVSPAGQARAATAVRPSGGAVVSLSCTSAEGCAGVGLLEVPHQVRPLVVSEKNGIWGRAGTVPGLSALPGGTRDTELVTVSCSSAGNCGAGGLYEVRGAHGGPAAPTQGLVVAERNGVWGKATAIPGLAGLNTGQAAVQLMSCRSAGS